MALRLPCPSLRGVATKPRLTRDPTPIWSSVPRATFASAPAGNPVQQTRLRKRMFQRLEEVEKASVEAPTGPLYVGPSPLTPFIHNPLFQSQPVLDEAAREMIWERAVKIGEPLKMISADLGVSLGRVAAVVRLKQIEKRWEAEGKKLARPYARAILNMLPTTSYPRGEVGNVQHEPIIDVPVHSFTTQQIFLPTSESHHFTRHDAAKAFHRSMTTAEERSGHKEFVEMVAARTRGQDKRSTRQEFGQKTKAAEDAHLAAIEQKHQRDEARTMKVHTSRFEFRFKTFNGDAVGRDGRKRGAVGWRYGAPLDDRKRGKVKIPTQCP